MCGHLGYLIYTLKTYLCSGNRRYVNTVPRSTAMATKAANTSFEPFGGSRTNGAKCKM